MTAGLQERQDDLAARVQQWIWRPAEQLCETIEPWQHGFIYRAPHYLRLADLNAIRVVDDPQMSPAEIIAFADRALSGVPHRQIRFDAPAAAEPLRPALAAAGYMTPRLQWMHFEGRREPGAASTVREVDYDAVHALRVAWHKEDFPGSDATEYLLQAKAIGEVLGSRVLAIYDGSDPVAFAILDLGEGELEIGGLYVSPEYRGQGLGTALVQTALAGTEGQDVWICADDEARPKHLYARLGFRPVLTTAQFLRLP